MLSVRKQFGFAYLEEKSLVRDLAEYETNKKLKKETKTN